jgi:hypothetical protein
MTESMTPDAFLNQHELTSWLRRLGVSAEQLEAMRFSWSNRDWPFEQWTVTWLEGTPEQAIPLVKPYCALKWVIVEDPPGSADKDAAWRLLAETLAAPVHALGLKFRWSQARRASRPRGKLADGRTLNQVIAELALRPEHRDATALELWPHLYAELDRLTLSPEETRDPKDPRRNAYAYDYRDSRKTITFGQFANVVSKSRILQKSG